MTHQISRNGDQVVPQTRQMTRLLVSVTVRGSVGPIQVIVSPEDTVHDLIKDVLKVYVKENRRPLLSEIHPSCFGLHYSPFNLPSKFFYNHLYQYIILATSIVILCVDNNLFFSFEFIAQTLILWGV